MKEFSRLDRLPVYVFAQVNALKVQLRQEGCDIVDMGMGNPDMATPEHIVKKLLDAAIVAKNHRYSASRGITKLRGAISSWYKRRFDVDIDPDNEAIATMGIKEGLAHLVLVTIDKGDVVFSPSPTYPIHPYSAIISGGDVRYIPIGPETNFFDSLMEKTKEIKPKMLVISFPHNPTTEVVDLAFFERIVKWAKEHDVMVVHDFAYADLVFDDYVAPSFLQAKGAKDVGVEFFSLSKSYNMAGWRCGFCVGNREIIKALERIKSYLDYGMFQAIQIASIIALNGESEEDRLNNLTKMQPCVKETRDTYQARRDVLCSGLDRIGWHVPPPKATMFVWAKIPEQYQKMGSLEFSKFLMKEAHVAVSPGVGFGEYGDDYVRFSLIENKMRMNQALRNLKKIL